MSVNVASVDVYPTLWAACYEECNLVIGLSNLNPRLVEEIANKQTKTHLRKGD